MKTTYLLGLVLSFALANPAYSAKRALLVGIGDYPNVTKLAGPQDDVANMSSLLQSSLGYESKDIKLLVDERASRKNILDTLEDWLVKSTEANDEVVFYYTGHGFQTNDLNGDEADGKDEAIAPYDVRIKGKEVINMITDDEIETIFAKLENRSATIIIDSCHSGTLTRGLFTAENQQYEKTINEFNRLANGVPNKAVIKAHRQEKAFIDSTPNRVVWTAVSAWQKALVDFEKKNGSVFTNRFISGIKDKAADANQNGVVSRAELLNYIRAESTDFCERNANNCRAGLTPTLESSKELLVENATNFSNSIVVDGVSSVTPAAYLEENLDINPTNALLLKVLPENRTYELGAKIGFEITSQISGYLVLLDINSAGEIVQIFPNKFTDEKNAEGVILANQKLVLPNRQEYGFDYFEAQAPKGNGKLVAIVIKDKVLPKDVSQNKDLMVLDQPMEYVQNVFDSLSGVWTQGETNRATEWVSNSVSYKIY